MLAVHNFFLPLTHCRFANNESSLDSAATAAAPWLQAFPQLVRSTNLAGNQDF
jgi:hypothetical protein